MKELNLTVEKRDGTGKGPNRRLRHAGDVPAIVYGPDTQPIPVKVNYLTIYRLMHGVSMSTIINLDIQGSDTPARKVIIRDLQKDPVSGELVHIDFHHIAMDRPITLTVPIRVEGIPLGVKTFGGIVEHIQRDVEISCLPADIPDELVLDISSLNIGESKHVSDLQATNVTILTDPKRTLVTLVPPTIVKSAAEEAAEAAAAAGEVPAEGAEAAEGAEGAEGEAATEGGDAKAEGAKGKEKEKGKEKGKGEEEGKGKKKEKGK